MAQNENLYCVIMAGGIGSRFWPLSRASKPKQFIDILGTGRSLIQQTFDRMLKICPPQNVLVVTSLAYRDLVIEQLPLMNPSNVLLEPMRRNTAPCIAYATHRIKAQNPNAIVIVAPSDHLIMNEDKFVDSINCAISFASSNNALLTLGMKPSRPETGYGYIQIDEKNSSNNNLYKVKTFTEKPNIDLAKVFLESGEFFWNSGIFVWSIAAITKAFEDFLPEVNSLFVEVAPSFLTPNEQAEIERIYSECRNISIDYGIMEKADNVFVVCAEFGWSDLGTWGSLYTHVNHDNSENAVIGKHTMLYNSKNLMLNAPDNKLVVVQGLDDYIVVDTDDVLLICRKQDEQQIKDFVADVMIKEKNFS